MFKFENTMFKNDNTIFKCDNTMFKFNNTMLKFDNTIFKCFYMSLLLSLASKSLKFHVVYILYAIT